MAIPFQSKNIYDAHCYFCYLDVLRRTHTHTQIDTDIEVSAHEVECWASEEMPGN